MGYSQLLDTKFSSLNRTNTHWLKSQDDEKGSSLLNFLLWFFFWISQLIFLTDFSLFVLSVSLNFSLVFLEVTGRTEESRRCFIPYWVASAQGFLFTQSCSLEKTRGNQLQHKQLTFPLHEESCKQLKQTACDQNVTSKEQAGKQEGA